MLRLPVCLQLLGVVLVCAGVCLAAWPAGGGSPLTGINPLYAAVFCFSMLFPALDTILKERVFRWAGERSSAARAARPRPRPSICACRALCPAACALLAPAAGHLSTPPAPAYLLPSCSRRQARQQLGTDLDLFVVNSVGSLAQALFVFLMLPMLTAARGMRAADLPAYLADGAPAAGGGFERGAGLEGRVKAAVLLPGAWHGSWDAAGCCVLLADCRGRAPASRQRRLGLLPRADPLLRQRLLRGAAAAGALRPAQPGLQRVRWAAARVLPAHAGDGGLTGAESREAALPGSCPAQAAPPGVTPCAESPAPAACSAAALELIRQAGNVAMSLTMSAIVPVTILAFTVGWAGLGLTAGQPCCSFTLA